MDLGNGRVYQLVAGVNTVGRKANSSKATVQIDTNDRYMSRVHAEIKFEKGFHFFRVLTDSGNETKINDQLIQSGDVLIIQHGDVIQLANTRLRFISEDEDDITLK